MNPSAVLFAVLRTVAVMFIVAAISYEQVTFLGISNLDGFAIPYRGELAVWNLVGLLLPAGFLWIYARDLSRWIIGKFEHPLCSGIMTAALISAAIGFNLSVHSIYHLFNLTEESTVFSSSILFIKQSIPAQLLNLFFFVLTVALIFYAPKIDEYITNKDRLQQQREKFKSMDV